MHHGFASSSVTRLHLSQATGGDDSGIRLWSLVDIWNPNVNLPHIINNPPRVIRDFAVIDNERIVYGIHTGCIYVEDRSTNTTHLLLDDPPSFGSYLTIAKSRDARYVFVGGSDGKLVAIDVRVTGDNCIAKDTVALGHKISSINCMWSNRRNLHILVVVTQSALWKSHVLLFDGTQFTCAGELNTANRIMGRASQCIMGADVLDVAGVSGDLLLIVGTREGSVLTYLMDDTTLANAESKIFAPAFVINRAHMKQAVTTVLARGSHVHTCGRDGHLMTYRISAKTAELYLMSSTRLIKGTLESVGDYARLT